MHIENLFALHRTIFHSAVQAQIHSLEPRWLIHKHPFLGNVSLFKFLSLVLSLGKAQLHCAILIMLHQFYGKLANINIFLVPLKGPFRQKNVIQRETRECFVGLYC